MANRPVIDDEEPAELNIALDKIQNIVLRARAFDQEDFPDEPDPGADPVDAQDRDERHAPSDAGAG